MTQQILDEVPGKVSEEKKYQQGVRAELHVDPRCPAVFEERLQWGVYCKRQRKFFCPLSVKAMNSAFRAGLPTCAYAIKTSRWDDKK